MDDEKAQRASLQSRLVEEIDEAELREPTFLTVAKVVWQSVLGAFSERPGQIIGLAFVLIMEHFTFTSMRC